MFNLESSIGLIRKNNIANGAMDRITMPSALLSRILLTQDPCQKQVVIRSSRTLGFIFFQCLLKQH